MTSDAELLQRHRPALRYDAQEPYRAISAASMTDHAGNLLVLKDGTVLARAPGEGQARLSLALLNAYPGGLKADWGDRLDAGADELAAAAKYQADPAYANRVYGRVHPGNGGLDETGLRWLQYWLWFYYNPKHLLGFGKHEGDWEMVQIALDGDDQPVVVTCSQHERGEARGWAGVEKLVAGDGIHPVIYVAPFSHANYFEKGAHPYPGGIDNPDGSEDPVLPELEELGPWRSWKGRWGNSTGVLQPLSRGKLGGVSPKSPAHQGPRWTHPANYHAEAEQVSFLRKLGRRLRRLGEWTYPQLQDVSARLEGQRLLVSYQLGRAPQRPAGQLYVTVHDPEHPDIVLLSSAPAISGRKGEVELLLPRALERVAVRASAFNAIRQRSDPLPATAEQSGAA